MIASPIDRLDASVDPTIRQGMLIMIPACINATVHQFFLCSSGTRLNVTLSIVPLLSFIFFLLTNHFYDITVFT